MDLSTVRQFFPIYAKYPDLHYLDSAATALKPASVIKAEMDYLEHYSGNIARGIYPLAEEATLAFEEARATVARFLEAGRPEEIIFTAGTTASLNLTAQLLAATVKEGDNIVVTALEHHSNFLPWKELAKERGAEFRILPINEEGFLMLEKLPELVDARTRVLALSAVSNVLGMVNPVAEITATVRTLAPEARVVVDAAQLIGHLPVSVKDWDADFVAFSGHKLFGPTGIGVLYGKYAVLDTLRPVVFGGGMVLDACAQDTLYKEVPTRFETGTPHIAGAIGLGAALRFIEEIGLDTIHAHEQSLITYTLDTLTKHFGNDLTILGTRDVSKKSGIVSFTLAGVHPHDVAQLLGDANICVRAGLQCAAPLHESLRLPASARISLSLYNTESDIDHLVTGLKHIRTVL